MSRFAERFLVEPDLFPARCGGLAWGNSTLWLDLPGGPYVLRGLSARQGDEIAARWGSWVRIQERVPDLAAHPSRADADGSVSGSGIEIRVERIDLREFHPGNRAGFDFDSELDRTPHRVRLAGRWFVAWFDPEFREPLVGTALWLAHDGGPFFQSAFENFLRVLVAYRLLAVEGLLLHSAAVVLNGKAFLCVGRSGMGKSTVTRLAHESGLQVMSDDLNTLEFSDGRLMATKLPFAGDFGHLPGRVVVPVAAILRLSKASTVELLPWSNASAQALLLSCSPFVNQDPFRYDALMRQVHSVSSEVALRELRFRIDNSFLKTLSILL